MSVVPPSEVPYVPGVVTLFPSHQVHLPLSFPICLKRLPYQPFTPLMSCLSQGQLYFDFGSNYGLADLVPS